MCRSTGGAVHRRVVGFGADGVPETSGAIPFGDDGDVSAWVEGRFAPWPFRAAEVDAATVTTWTLQPE